MWFQVGLSGLGGHQIPCCRRLGNLGFSWLTSWLPLGLLPAGTQMLPGNDPTAEWLEQFIQVGALNLRSPNYS